MNRLTIPSIITIIFVLSGCGEPAIDGSSEEAAEESVENLREDLSNEEKEDFNEALSAIIFEDIGDLEGLFDAAMQPEEFVSEVKDKIDGLTAAEIIEKGNEIAEKQAEREKKDLADQIESYEQRIVEAENAREQIAEDITVTTSEFKIRDPEIGSTRGLIEIGVRNETDKWISAIRFESEVISNEREVPWIEDRHRYEISGGLGPGESDTWTLRPSGVEWSNPDAPESANLEITMSNAEDESGNRLYDVDDLGDFEKSELENLRERYEELTN